MNAELADAMKHGWSVIVSRDPDDYDVHVVPMGDTMQHSLSRTCWCKPQVESDDALLAVVVSHHALDGRE